MIKYRRVFTIAALLLTFSVAAASPVERNLVILAGTLIDGLSPTPQVHISIFVHGDTIVAVKQGFEVPPGFEKIDLSTGTVLPGFIDAHVHMSLRLPGSTNQTEYAVMHSDLDRAFDGAQFSREMLQQGFTSARDVGGGDETVALRNAINDGKTPGPRLSVSLEPIGPTGGHNDPRNGFDRLISSASWSNGLADSPEEARRRVREHKRRGADLIKVMPSGGISSVGDDPNQQLMADDEIFAAVDTAHSLGMKVAAHAYSPSSIEASVRAGVDSIEHGSFATARTLALMKARGVYLVPTLTVYELFNVVAREHPESLGAGTVAKELKNDPLPKQNFRLALRSGVKIAYGTDIGEGDHGEEFQLMIANGMSPIQAVFAATRNAAELLNANQVGVIRAGALADIVATAGDPLQNPAELRRVIFVMKGGLIYRLNGVPTPAGAGTG